ncbi:universal stress protein [Methylocystis heyeri]|uniref:Universal stress protein n=1 Tax=Methylocystis heyeri TaxID=391905 RepID=A0A6B8KE50_9HYPH|nr:universal stress protein [Methylocystis heyeri]QGM45957.1 universal stress protein [Methylocystis heyeri]
MKPQLILVAADGSAGASRAVDTAAAFARKLDADLLIVTIAGSAWDREIDEAARSERDAGEAVELLANAALREARERAERAGAPRVRTWFGWGDAAEEIMGLIDREKPEMAILGRRGRGRLTGLLLGSVSQKLASLAPCLVTIVP